MHVTWKILFFMSAVCVARQMWLTAGTLAICGALAAVMHWQEAKDEKLELVALGQNVAQPIVPPQPALPTGVRDDFDPALDEFAGEDFSPQPMEQPAAQPDVVHKTPRQETGLLNQASESIEQEVTPVAGEASKAQIFQAELRKGLLDEFETVAMGSTESSSDVRAPVQPTEFRMATLSESPDTAIRNVASLEAQWSSAEDGWASSPA